MSALPARTASKHADDTASRPIGDGCGITTLGFGSQTSVLLEYLLQRRGGHFRLAPANEAKIALLDLDSAACIGEWEALRTTYPYLVPICLGTQRKASPDGIDFVSKPIDPARLLEAIDLCAARFVNLADRSTTGAHLWRSDLTGIPATGDDATRATYLPASYLAQVLVEALAAARRRGGPMTLYLRGRAHRCMVIDPSNGGWISNSIPTTLLHYLARTAGIPEKLVVEAASPDITLDATDRIAADALIWDFAILAAHGRVPLGTDPNRPLRLRRWPNLTRWIETPGAMTLACQWSLGTTLEQIRRNSGVPLAAVNSFYAACTTTDLFESTGETAGHWQRVATTVTAPTRFLSGLVQRLLVRD